jgi:hypothetical protein
VRFVDQHRNEYLDRFGRCEHLDVDPPADGEARII